MKKLLLLLILISGLSGCVKVYEHKADLVVESVTFSAWDSAEYLYGATQGRGMWRMHSNAIYIPGDTLILISTKELRTLMNR